MGSMNNWLGFSLSPQELQENSVPHLGFNSDAQISTQSCFDLPEDSPIPSLNLPAPPFGILEAFNRNSHSQDWNMKEVNMNSFSCSSLENNQDRPKLENFLGVSGSHTFPDHHQEQEKICSYTYNIYPQADSAASEGSDAAVDMNSTTIGLSMIKNWLRNNPAPPHAVEDKEAAAPPAPGVAQTLSLSMSTGSQSSSSLPSDSKAGDGQTGAAAAIESVPRKSIDTFGQRTSIYRGVTRHRWTGRYEAHLWDNSCRREGQTRKGRQVYLGGYDKEEKAARAYDLAALKYWGTTTTTNFPMSNYEKEIEEMKNMTRQEYVASLRRKSSGFSRGASIYRGVTRHHQHGRWQARIGRVAGNKDLYLGTFSTQEEAAEAYDIAAIKFRGLNAVTNFEINRYDVKSILESSTLPIGGAAKRLKEAENAEMALDLHRANEANLNLHLAEGQISSYGSGNSHPWPAIGFQQAQPLGIYPYAHQRLWCKQEQDTEISHGYNENINHQLQLGNTQNFFMNNIMSLDSSSMDSSSVAYGNGDTNVSPLMGTVVVQDGNQNGFLGNHEEGMFGSSAEAYQQARNLYYASSAGLGKPGLYDQSPAWIPTGVPTISTRTNMAVPTFTVWNDT